MSGQYTRAAENIFADDDVGGGTVVDTWRMQRSCLQRMMWWSR